MGSNCFDYDMATSLTIHSDLEGTQYSVYSLTLITMYIPMN